MKRFLHRNCNPTSEISDGHQPLAEINSPSEAQPKTPSSPFRHKITSGEKLITFVMSTLFKSTHVIPFICHIPPSSQSLIESLFPFSVVLPLLLGVFLVLSIHQVSSSVLQPLSASADALCTTRNAAEEAARVNRREGITHTAPWQRKGGRTNSRILRNLA